ncbi:CDP-alcohol phosphatidyltransferase family protein [Dongia rigui]|uniref:CDP-alcohol phosphatidyltransferase family protein n=1 Tax=Dongia rigui TaxID=940149 RepID=A0ABU5DSY0_9PROT|nr:CDP-alcohol phosphatidyltransferase family protein [Dongia rigui]MDY0870471.1 CDP-alcohol phosphatidyltransferase family protein [Dongia rigui]
MFDRALRRRIDPSLERLARKAQAAGLTADRVTWIGFGLGLLAIVAIASGAEFWGLVLLGANRLCDGIDGSLARLTRPTDRGAYLDIVLDFIFYAGFVFACAVARPEHAVAAAFLIFSFVGTGTTFLAHAIMAAKRNQSDEVTAGKGIAYLGGFTEGTETIAVFVLMLLFPGAFNWLAWLFGILCWLTTATRIAATLRALPA